MNTTRICEYKDEPCGLWKTGRFHGFSIDSDIESNGVANFPVAIIENDSGEIVSRCLSFVMFPGGESPVRLIRPSVEYRPEIYLDGNKWCALYGVNLQEGVAGFGDSPAEAMSEFDRNWTAKVNQ